MDIHKYLGIDLERVKVVFNGVDAVFNTNNNEIIINKIREKYTLPDEYIFYIGGFDFRKNIKVLLEAYAEARKKGIREMLVLGGKFSPSMKQLKLGLVDNISQIAIDLNIQDDIRILGPISQEDLPYLYKMARLFVYPSLYEGFGLPPLEAMACGTPVLASNRSSIPEIIDRDDLLFDPDDSKKLCEKMQWLLADVELRHSISEWGLKKASSFSWPRNAKQILDLYDLVCRVK
jgi:glycosyltransferase involved in cell wall biosynthesis